MLSLNLKNIFLCLLLFNFGSAFSFAQSEQDGNKQSLLPWRIIKPQGKNDIHEKKPMRGLREMSLADRALINSVMLDYLIDDNNNEARAVFLALAEKGNGEAQYMLAGLYRDDDDVVQSIKWYKQAALQGSLDAQEHLATFYMSDRNDKKNIFEVEKWLSLAAAQGSLSSQVKLGDMYYFGTELERNNFKAAKLYLLAASQGDGTVQGRLGAMYYDGLGIPQNFAEAYKWSLLPAQKGDKISQFVLGEMYLKGRVVKPNMARAYMWFNLSAMNGHQQALKERESVLNKMTSQQIDAAQKLATQCLLSKSTECW